MHTADDWSESDSSMAEEMRLDAEMWTELPAAVAGPGVDEVEWILVLGVIRLACVDNRESLSMRETGARRGGSGKSEA